MVIGSPLQDHSYSNLQNKKPEAHVLANFYDPDIDISSLNIIKR